MSLSSEQHHAVGTFLRARRDTLSPEDVGLHPLPGRRRAKGLLREGGARKFHHPVDGSVDFDQTILTFTTWPQYQLVTVRSR